MINSINTTQKLCDELNTKLLINKSKNIEIINLSKKKFTKKNSKLISYDKNNDCFSNNVINNLSNLSNNINFNNNLQNLSINTNQNVNMFNEKNINVNKVKIIDNNGNTNNIMTMIAKEKLNKDNEKRICNKYFNGNLNINEKNLDNLNNSTNSHINSTSTCLSSSFNSINGSLNGKDLETSDNYSNEINSYDDSNDEINQPNEMDSFLDDNETTDQKIVEVLRQLVRDCTNPDPTKRPSSFQVTERLQPFLNN